MTFIIAGTPRAGKSTLRTLLLQEHKIPGFCTDYLRDGIDHKVPVFGIKDGMTDAEKSEVLWPMFQGMIEQRSKYYTDNLVIEGTNFLPKYLNQFNNDPKVRIVFLGFPTVTSEKKYLDIKNLSSPDDDWTRDLSDTELKELVNEFIGISKYFRDECKKYDIQFFDTSENMEAVIKQAANYLTHSG